MVILLINQLIIMSRKIAIHNIVQDKVCKVPVLCNIYITQFYEAWKSGLRSFVQLKLIIIKKVGNLINF